MLSYIWKIQESGLIEIVAFYMHLNNLGPGILFFSILNSPQGAPLGMGWLEGGQNLLFARMAGNILCSHISGGRNKKPRQP